MLEEDEMMAMTQVSEAHGSELATDENRKASRMAST